MWTFFLTYSKKKQALVEHVNQFNSLGVKISSVQLKSKTKEILKEKESETTTLGETWWRQFKKRNPSIVFKKPEKMDVAIPAIREYFEQLRVLCLEHNIPSSRIFNADETGIPLSPDLSKSIGIKGKSLKLRASETHEQLTMMVTVFATGEIFSPLFI